MGIKCDFSGWATKNDTRCSDGRTIRENAFKNNDGKIVPLVWQHQHSSLENVLGHALLENRREGVYAYCTLNNTDMGRTAREAVNNGDITSLSIYANQLQHEGHDVVHGVIREVSLVLAGANPEAIIDHVSLAHSDDGELLEAYAFAKEDIILHADGEVEDNTEEVEEEVQEEVAEEQQESDSNEEEPMEVTEEMVQQAEDLAHADESTVGEVLNSMTEDQKKVMYYLIGEALQNNAVEHSDLEEEDYMKKNVFDGEEMVQENVLSHAEIQTIFADAKRCGSLKEAVLAHTDGNDVEYGMTNIDYLYPDYKTLRNTPEFVSRKMDWVAKVMGAVHHTPFSRIKSIFADIREEDARAKGYVRVTLS